MRKYSESLEECVMNHKREIEPENLLRPLLIKVQTHTSHKEPKQPNKFPSNCKIFINICVTCPLN